MSTTGWPAPRERRRRCRIVGAVLTTGLAVVVPACGSDDDGDSDVIRLDESTRTATVEVGDVVVVTIGEVNSSIGDAWKPRTSLPKEP